VTLIPEELRGVWSAVEIIAADDGYRARTAVSLDFHPA